MKHLSDKDVLSGLMFLLIGAFGLFLSSGFEFGSTARPGPGFFPIVLSCLMIVVGAGVTAGAVLRPIAHYARIVWRPFLLITLAVLVFAFGIERFGLIPSVFAATITASFSKSSYGNRQRVLAASALAAFSAVIFVGLLNLPISLWSI